MFEVNKWYPWLLDQDSFWIDRDGLTWAVTTIEGRYALNILKFIWRTHRADVDDVLSEPYFARPLAVALMENVRRDLSLYPSEVKRLVLAEPDESSARDWDLYDDLWDHID